MRMCDWSSDLCSSDLAAIGTAGAYISSLVPLLSAHEEPSPVTWASALVTPIVISVLVAVTAILTSMVRRSTAGLRRALEEASAATAESQRIGAVMQSFAEEIDLGMAYVPLDDSKPFFNHALENFAALAGIDGAIGIGTRFCYEDQVRSEEHTSELPSLMRTSYAVCCLKQKTDRRITLAFDKP